MDDKLPITVALFWERGLNFNAPLHGDGRYPIRLWNVIQELCEESFVITPKGDGNSLTMKQAERRHINLMEVERIEEEDQYVFKPAEEWRWWTEDNADVLWYAQWTIPYRGRQHFIKHPYDRAILWLYPAIEATVNIYKMAKKGMYWFPPLYPIKCEKTLAVTYSPNSAHHFDIALLANAKEIYRLTGQPLRINRMTWFIDKSKETKLWWERLLPIYEKVKDYVELHRSFPYSQFQQWIAQSKIFLCLHHGPSMLAMEALIHNTGIVCLANQEEYLRPGEGHQVNDYRGTGSEAKRAEEVMEGIELLWTDEEYYHHVTDKAVKRMRDISNPHKQKEKIRKAIMEDLQL